MERIKCVLVEIREGSPGYWNPETNEWYSYQTLPVGAMFFADDEWARDTGYLGPDEKCLVVKLPTGFWYVDSRASNCTMPHDKVHRCWVRHGEAPSITVDKNGLTCGAGAGSIQKGDYHGFLRNGYLESC